MSHGGTFVTSMVSPLEWKTRSNLRRQVSSIDDKDA